MLHNINSKTSRSSVKIDNIRVFFPRLILILIIIITITIYVVVVVVVVVF